MSISDSMRSQFDNHVQQMYTKNLKGESQSATQKTGEDSVHDLSQALEDNKITGKELESLRKEYAKQGVSSDQFDKAISDIFGISTAKVKAAGSSDAVITLEMEDSGKSVNVNPKSENLEILTTNFNIMDNKTIYDFSHDPEINGGIHDGLGTPQNADQVKSLQKFLNDCKPQGKEKLDVDGLYGPLTMGRLKDVFADAVKNKDFKTVDKLILVIEAVNNKVNKPGKEVTDTQLQALYDAGSDFWGKNTKGKMTIGDIEILPNKK